MPHHDPSLWQNSNIPRGSPAASKLVGPGQTDEKCKDGNTQEGCRRNGWTTSYDTLNPVLRIHTRRLQTDLPYLFMCPLIELNERFYGMNYSRLIVSYSANLPEPAQSSSPS